MFSALVFADACSGAIHQAHAQMARQEKVCTRRSSLIFGGNLSSKGVLSFLSFWPQHGDTCLILTAVTMQLHELSDIKLGLLQNLDFADQCVLKWEDALGLLLDFFADGLWD